MENWNKIEDEKKSLLQRDFEFKDFSEAWGFMNRVALITEKLQHHPTWKNTYNSVTIELSTHDAGDVITEKDEKMAEAINQLL